LNGQFTLITGRTQAQGRGLHLGRDSEAYQRATRLVEMNSDDMAELGLVDGRLVRISTSAGEVQVPVQAGNLPRGMLFMPMGPAAGQEVSWEEAISRAAAILDAADSPIIYGLSSTATEAQRKALKLADRLGAMIDTTSSVCHGPSGLAMQAVGEPTCTLGEVRNRADLILFWGCNPAESHQRHFSRYSVTPKGTLTPQGRRDRTVVVVDVRPAAESVGGIPLGQLQALVEQMKECRFGVVHMGMGLTQTRGRDMNVSEIFALVADLNHYTRFSVIPMRGHGNVAGGDQVMAWQSGYPFAVSYARGYPRYGPGEFSTVDVLARGEADAALIIASDPAAHFPHAAAQHLERIPTIVLDPMPTLTAKSAQVVLPTACYGLDAAGTAYRMDAVPIRLRAILPRQRPTDEEVLDRIIEAVQPC